MAAHTLWELCIIRPQIRLIPGLFLSTFMDSPADTVARAAHQKKKVDKLSKIDKKKCGGHSL